MYLHSLTVRPKDIVQLSGDPLIEDSLRYAVGRMTKSRRGKLYIDDAGWGPDAGSIEYRYWVPFGGIHVFIGKIGEPGPKPDICTDIVETAQRARPAWAQPTVRRAFVVASTEGSFLKDLWMAARRLSTLTASRP